MNNLNLYETIWENCKTMLNGKNSCKILDIACIINKIFISIQNINRIFFLGNIYSKVIKTHEQDP